MSTANKLKIAGKTNRQRTEWLPARHGTQDRIPDPLSHRSRATEPAFIWKDTNYDYCHGVCLGLIFFLWCFVVLVFLADAPAGQNVMNFCRRHFCKRSKRRLASVRYIRRRRSGASCIFSIFPITYPRGEQMSAISKTASCGLLLVARLL